MIMKADILRVCFIHEGWSKFGLARVRNRSRSMLNVPLSEVPIEHQ